MRAPVRARARVRVRVYECVYGCSITDQLAANAGFVNLDAAGDPNNTRDWADINEPAQNNRNAPGGFKLAGGHMFGDNTEVLLPAA